jgi:tRNA(fMet)-specific endonuclease VapC
LLERFNRNASHLAMSSITLAELMHGAEKSSDPPRSLAVVEGLTLVSNNLREFERVEGLLYENWV